jgi:hypothetical protein
MQSMSRCSRIVGFGSSALLVGFGVAGGIAFRGTFGQILAIVLVSLGLVLATGLVFYEVGLSEDRERAREDARRRQREEPREIRNLPRSRRSRLDRRRGARRRLR